jgi:cell division protein YceG involved in septum cleavage
VFLGIGIGLILSSGFNIIFHQNQNITYDEEFIKSEARKIGMIDPVQYFDKQDMNNNMNEVSTRKKEEKNFIIEIQKGHKSEDIARLLKENNLIQSEREFLNKINERKLENKLRWGTYEFTSNDSQKEIIDKIVKGEYKKE